MTHVPGRREYQHFEESEEAPFEEVSGDLEGLYDFLGPEFPTQYAPSQIEAPAEEETKELARAGTFLESVRDVIVDQMPMPDYTLDFTAPPKHRREVEAGPSEEVVMKKAHHDEAAIVVKIEEGHAPSALEPTSEAAPSIVSSSSVTKAISSAPDVVAKIALSTSDVMMPMLVGEQRSLAQATESVVSEGIHSFTSLLLRQLSPSPLEGKRRKKSSSITPVIAKRS
ncbi:uncharacterized protein A4U43_UnF5000 [Asparagus officinalis]|uniref:Uncharacterized protein n=1 Tax=Asparagus officinalis TaxID=4686 RepID=A0A1R3L6S5_ASPOF|nr:uncharacterized protein A4U43_UnF5000 [Asparagus officinalis]